MIALALSLFVFGCADSGESSSKSSAEKISVTVKTEADISSARSILPSLCGTFRLYFKEKGASDSTYKLADGEYPDYQMIIIPGEYTFRLDSVISEADPTVILTGETDFTVESGMESVTICFMLSSPEGATGDGSVRLYLSADTDTNIKTFSVSAGGTGDTPSISWSEDEEETSYIKGTLSCTSLAPGTYTLLITGLNSSGEPVYVRHEVLTVWSNVVSGRWLFADGTETDELKITTSDLYSTFYVKGEEGTYTFYTDDVFGDVTASDINSGSMDSPLETVSAAVKKCVISGKQYTIYVDGTVKECADSSSDDPTAISISSGKKITIKSLDPKGERKSVIQADGNGRIILAGGTVILEDLELNGGSNVEDGGGIYIESTGALTMKNCTLTDCNATLQGGGLYIASSGSANLSGCTISGNEATDTASGIGGGIMANGTLIADDTSISNNKSGNGGGGLYIESSVTATLTGCELSTNETIQSGGAIKNSGILNITDCSFIENEANIGGGIDVAGATGNVTITGTGVDTCVFKNNKASGGGAMSVSEGTVNATKVTFDTNSSSAGDQSGNGGGLWIIKATVILKNCTLSNNTASNNGGAVHLNEATSWVSSTASSLTMNGCTVSSNTAPNGGGGICIDDANGTVEITGCTISENNKSLESISGYGGGIYVKAAKSFSVEGGTISSNAASSGGGLKICSIAELTNCEISQNSSGGDGGGFGCVGSDSATINVTFTNCDIIENEAGNNGGGGEILSNVDATFNSCEIEDNTTKYNGGGLILFGTPNVTLEDCTISGNTANNESGKGGGGIRTDSTGPTLTLTGTTSISGNITPSGSVGKSMYLNSGHMYISGAIQIADDVSLRTDGDTIRTTITGTLTGTTPVITITPTVYTAGKQIVDGSGVTLSNETEKIAISANGDGKNWYVKTDGTLAY